MGVNSCGSRVQGNLRLLARITALASDEVHQEIRDSHTEDAFGTDVDIGLVFQLGAVLVAVEEPSGLDLRHRLLSSRDERDACLLYQADGFCGIALVSEKSVDLDNRSIVPQDSGARA